MSLNIIDLVKGQLGPALVSQLATKYGESESSIFKGIKGFLPILLGSVIKNLKSDGFYNTMIEACKSGILGNLLNLSDDNPYISSTLPLLINNKVGVTDEIAKYANINNESAISLLTVVTGAVLGGIGKHTLDNKLTINDLEKKLTGEKSRIISMLPEGISSDKVGLSDFFLNNQNTNEEAQNTNITKNITPKVTPSPNHKSSNNDIKTDSVWKWLLPLLLLLAVGYYLFYQYRISKTEEVNKEVISTEVEVVTD